MNNAVPPASMQRISALHRWTLNPTNVDDLKVLLATLSDEELIYTGYLFPKAGEPVSRIAWAEYAQRKKYFDFEIRMVQVSPNELRLVFESQATAVHTQPILDLKVPS